MGHRVAGFFYLMMLLNHLSAFGAETDTLKNRRHYLPDYVPLQFAGNIGLLSSGFGWIPGQGRYQVALMYGYVPRSVAKYDPIHMLTVKNSFDVYRLRGKREHSWVGYFGIGLTVEVGGISFLKLPSNYDAGSYFPKAIHVVPFAGLRSFYGFGKTTNWVKGIEPFVEIGTIDAYLWYKSLSESLPITKVFSLALGVNVRFE